MNIPILITLSRILAIPLIVVLLLYSPTLNYAREAAFLLFVISSGTDWLDGYLARRLNQVTSLGKLLDPLADKLLVMTLLLWFVAKGEIAFYWVALILGREFAVNGLRSIAALKNIVIKAEFWGKAKTVIQLIVLGWLLLELPNTTPLVWLMVVITIWSGGMYFWSAREVFRHG